MNYYNEFDPRAAAWIRQLIAGGLIPKGEVDERSIVDVRGSDLTGFTQCHFFAGVAGWPYALQLAGFPETESVWTGSCPCQPFSQAGKRKGESDKRHLWPDFRRLIEECRPSRVFGEQVASKPGRRWLNGVRANLEDMGYEVGAADLCSPGVGAPHIRQRLYWMADSGHESAWRSARSGEATGGRSLSYPARRGNVVRMAVPACRGLGELRDAAQPWSGGYADCGSVVDGMGDPNIQGSQRRRIDTGEYTSECAVGETGPAGRMADSGGERRQQIPGSASDYEDENGREGRFRVEPNSHNEPSGYGEDGIVGMANTECRTSERHGSKLAAAQGGMQGSPREQWLRDDAGDGVEPSHWDDFDIVHCEDGKSRRVERGTFPLVARLPKGMVYSSDPGAPIDPQETGEARITRLRGYGNAITPQVAAEFIKVCMEAMGMGRKKKAPEVADPKQARCIAETIVSLGLSPEDPDNWVKAIIHADLYPNAETVEEAQRELARMMRPPIQIATRRDAHHLRRRR